MRDLPGRAVATIPNTATYLLSATLFAEITEPHQVFPYGPPTTSGNAAAMSRLRPRGTSGERRNKTSASAEGCGQAHAALG